MINTDPGRLDRSPSVARETYGAGKSRWSGAFPAQSFLLNVGGVLFGQYLLFLELHVQICELRTPHQSLVSLPSLQRTEVLPSKPAMSSQLAGTWFSRNSKGPGTCLSCRVFTAPGVHIQLPASGSEVHSHLPGNFPIYCHGHCYQ